MIIDINEKFKIFKKSSNFSEEIESNFLKKYNQNLSLILKHNNDKNNYRKYFNNLNYTKCFFFFLKKNQIIIEEIYLSSNYYKKETFVNVNIEEINTFFINKQNLNYVNFHECGEIFYINNIKKDNKTIGFLKNNYSKENIQQLKKLLLNFINYENNINF
tara:strand:- start:23698 stop:24177 length:480 start_codon:yes stop_codon:yes gene_type:complete